MCLCVRVCICELVCVYVCVVLAYDGVVGAWRLEEDSFAELVPSLQASRSALYAFQL